MVAALTLLLVCQLAGESLSRLLQLPVPGPVLGMILLLLLLMVRRRTLALIEPTADALLANLILMYVPACVGLMAHFKTIRAEWEPIVVAVVGSTVLTLVVTALAFKLLMPRRSAAERTP